ncbi:MAG: hypothetical protein MUF61_00095 [archaeon]|nr:hypothetical protein [archaeon]
MKRMLVFAIVLMISMQGVFAISTNLKDSYKPGETVASEIYGNILEPITKDSVEFRRGHVLVPFEYDLKRLGDKYYLWMITPENEENYTLIIKDITTTVSGEIKEVDYEKNFTTKGNLSDYSVKPGFIYAQSDFELTMNLNQDMEKSIQINFPNKTNIVLKPGENKFMFSIGGINKTELRNITIGKYSLPMYVIVNKTITADVTNATKEEEEEEKEEKIEIRTENQSGQRFENFSIYPCSGTDGLNGKICAADEVCSGKEVVSADGICCNIGECMKKEQVKKGGNAWIGYVVAALVIIGGVFIWIKYKGVKKEENPIEKAARQLSPRSPYFFFAFFFGDFDFFSLTSAGAGWGAG